MPRFYFDLDDGQRHSIDDEGMDVSSLEEAKRKAVETLPQVAHDVLPDGDSHVVTANVRDESGCVRIRASLTLLVETNPK